MEDQRQTRYVSRGVIAGLSAVVLAAGGGGAWWAWNTLSPQVPASPSAPTVQQPHSQAIQPANEQTAQIYWLKDSGSQLELVPSQITVESADQPAGVLETAFDQLLEGPANSEVATTIPEETELRSLEVRSDGIHVDLSQEFTYGGGSASMTGRVAQVIYTATSLEPAAKVWISVEGEPLEVLGGEGLAISQPLTRQEFDRDFAL